MIPKIKEHHENLSVTPAMHRVAKKFIDNKQLVFSLMDAMGSPLNIIFPEVIAENIADFERVYAERHLRGKIFYTSKPNKSMALRKRAALTNAGLDVSSEGELKTGLASGFHPSRIEATGPKNQEYLSLAVQQDVLINVDNFAELQSLVGLHSILSLKRKIRILVRLNDFKSSYINFSKRDSAFGINVSESGSLLDFLAEHKEQLDFQGFSFHFNVSDFVRRPSAIESCIELTFAARERGLNPKAIDIGGGYRVTHAESSQEWDHFNSALKEAVLGKRPFFTWNNTGLGFTNEEGVLKGGPNFIEHYHDLNGANDLAAILDTPLPHFDGQTAAQILSEAPIELYVEPGRAALDQCGITLARVNSSKLSMAGERLLMMDMNRTNLNAVHMKLMTDPIVIYRSEHGLPATSGVYYMGNLGLSDDLIQYHQTFPPFEPQANDIIAFMNTAAYHMDFVETPVLQQRVAEKIVIIEEGENFRWFRDEIYNPLAFRMAK